MEQPLVSVICISYNHGAFVYKALSSLYNQYYSNIEVIIADDCSTDQTQEEIKRFVANHPAQNWTIVLNESNLGNCKTFNRALKLAKGKYVIDLAADDLLYNQCIGKQVKRFEELPEHYGVLFSNVDLVDVNENFRAKHYMTDSNGKAIRMVPKGDVYRKIVKRYFISPVGMMVKRSVLDELGGYDESLAYEDFDFWVRSSRLYKYAYLDECLVAKRETPHSLSTRFTRRGNNRMFVSTARICQKIAWLNRSKTEDLALVHRITYEIRQSIRYGAYDASIVYLRLMKELKVNLFKRIFYRILVVLIG
ncbi:MAG: b-glycosyltransferase, glycosyltransferase family 2 protein [Cytophagaceae bacterium]|jgi:glycosyltransferase involved in cell wall biosynthesis|nr:b-glycosyltransferase, glycosyltransferase family 2 protein [Cytophagaceae bacterium]